MNFTAWYKNISCAEVAALMPRELVKAGFSLWESSSLELAAADGPGIEPSYHGWEAVRVGRQKIFYDVSPRTEAHVQVTLYTRKNNQRVFPRFYNIFRRLIEHPSMPAREVCFSVGSGDDYPFFTFEQFRHQEPLSIVDLDVNQDYAAGDEAYWQQRGSRLHFVSSALLAEAGVPAAGNWAKNIRASVDPTSHGVIFDCGWAAVT